MTIDQSTPTLPVTVAVPVEALVALLGGWSEMTARYGRDVVSAEADDAYDDLSELLADAVA